VEELAREIHNNLLTITKFKADQIITWRNENLKDAHLIQTNSFLTNSIDEWESNKINDADRIQTINWLKSFQVDNGYSHILLLDGNFKYIWSSEPSDSLGPHGKESAIKSIQSGSILFSDLHRAPNHPEIHIDMHIPLFLQQDNSAKLIAMLVVRLNPADFLYPLIQSWPTISKSAETILIRKQGDSILCLNELRHLKNTALNLRFPISNTIFSVIDQYPSQSFSEGLDYRNVQVISYTMKIPGTDWFVMSKIDRDEIYAPVRREAFIILIIIISLITLSLLVGILIWKNRQAKYYRDEYLSEVERKALLKHFEYLFKLANDALFLLSVDGKIIEANEHAVKVYGYTHEELLRLNVIDFRTDKNKAAYDKIVKKVIESDGYTFESIHVKKNGLLFQVEISSRLIDIDGKHYFQSIIRDITDRKQFEKALKESEIRYRELFDNNPNAMWVYEVDSLRFIMVNDAAVLQYGYSKKEFLSMTIKDIRPKGELDRLIENVNRTRDKFQKSDLWRHRKKDGTIINVELFSHSLPELNGLQRRLVMVHDVTEGKKAAESLKESEVRYSSLFENMLEGYSYCKMIFENDEPVDFIYLAVNDAFEKLTGLKNVVGKKVSEVIPDIKNTTPELFNIYARAALTGNSEKFEIFVAPLDIHFSISVYSPEKEYFIAVFDNITDRVRAKIALQESEVQYRSLVEVSTDAIMIIQKDLVLYANPAAVKLHGAEKPEQLIGKSAFELTHPDEHAEINEQMRRLIESNDKFWVEERKIIRLDGTFVEAEVSIATFIFKGEKAVQVVLRDITERKKAETEILRLNRVYSILSNINKAIVRIRNYEELFKTICEIAVRDGKFIFAWIGKFNDSNTFEEPLNYYPENIDFFSSNGVNECNSHLVIRPCLESIKAMDYFVCNNVKNLIENVPCIKKAAEIGFNSMAAFSIKIDNKLFGNIHFYSSDIDYFKKEEIDLLNEVSEDISYALKNINDEKLRQAKEAELIIAKEDAEKSARLKTEFLAQMSHEIRSPMNIVLSFASLLKEDITGKIDIPLNEYFDGIESAGRRLIRTVDLILNVSELQVGAYDPDLVNINLLTDVFDPLKSEFVNIAQKKGLELNIFSTIDGPVIYGDKYSINQIFVNLIDNAIKYTHEGYINVTISKNENHQITVIVEDSGIGISKEFIDTIFEPFMQEERGYSRKFEGSGLGLTLVKKYCDINSAEIKVVSEKGAGSMFIVTFIKTK
jgi:PAS domain S-box-containing protein